jgi:membrane-bound lytic murein transglycosylase B
MIMLARSSPHYLARRFWCPGFGIWAAIFVYVIFVCAGPAPGGKAVTGDFGTLDQQLVAEGFDAEQVAHLFVRSDARFDPESVTLFFLHSEAKLNYKQFLKPAAIDAAKQYMATYHAEMAVAQRHYGVEPEVIAAILQVETRLGNYLGSSRVFNTLATMAALQQPVLRQRLWDEISADRRLSRKEFEIKADRKSQWAYNELKAFLRYSAKEGIDPLLISGSYAGAMGICQFMPSNIVRLAADGNSDGRVDLFEHADAIASVARYLQAHGWVADISDQKAHQVIRRYNNSRPYADTVLAIARQLKG